MTDQDPTQSTPSGEGWGGERTSGEGEGQAPLHDEPFGDVPPEGESAQGSAQAHAWISQLESMIQNISTQAAPVARQVGAKAAELAAVAAVKAGPAAQKAADFTAEYGQKFADRAHAVAAEWRAQDGAGAHATTNGSASTATAEPGSADEPTPDDTSATGL